MAKAHRSAELFQLLVLSAGDVVDANRRGTERMEPLGRASRARREANRTAARYMVPNSPTTRMRRCVEIRMPRLRATNCALVSASGGVSLPTISRSDSVASANACRNHLHQALPVHLPEWHFGPGPFETCSCWIHSNPKADKFADLLHTPPPASPLSS